MKKAKAVTTVFAALVISAALFAQGGAGSSAGKKDIVDTAVSAGNFNTLAAALTEAGLADALKGKGPFTVFAPTDEAFAKLPKGTVESLLKPENSDKLSSILTYHVVSGKVTSADVAKLKAAETLNGQRIDITVSGESAYVDGARVVSADIEATNGVIHVIDTVLLPSHQSIVGVAGEAGQFETLLAAAKAAGLAEALDGDGPFTVFAPTDEAFGRLPDGTVEDLLKKENLNDLAAILKYHVIQGRLFSDEVLKKESIGTLQGDMLKVSMKDGTAMVNKSAILKTDIDASNGVIHVIDHVLLPPERHSSAGGTCN